MSKHKKKRPAGLRAVTALFATGSMLVVAGGVVLGMQTSASADPPKDPPGRGHIPVQVCHATGSDTNPYVFLTVDDDSLDKPNGHGTHRADPNKQWKTAGTWHGVAHAAGDPKADYIADYTDAQGTLHRYDGSFDEAWCEQDGTPPAPKLVTPRYPTTGPATCEADGTLNVPAQPEGVVMRQDGTPPGEVTFTFTPAEGYAFPAGTDVSVTLTVAKRLSGPQCENPPAPVEVTPGVSFTEATCADPSGAGVVYAHQDRVRYTVTAGSVGEGRSVRIEAAPRDGFVFPAGAVTQWSHTFVDYESLDCATPTTPTTPTTPDEPTTPTTPDEPTVAGTEAAGGIPTVIDAGLGGPTGGGWSQGRLAGLSLTGAGLVLLAAASALQLGRRARGAHQV